MRYTLPTLLALFGLALAGCETRVTSAEMKRGEAVCQEDGGLDSLTRTYGESSRRYECRNGKRYSFRPSE